VVAAIYLAGSAGLAAVAVVGARRLRRSVALVTVRGLSMEPALNAGDRLLIRRVTAGRLRTGQIVVIDRPAEAGRADETGRPDVSGERGPSSGPHGSGRLASAGRPGRKHRPAGRSPNWPPAGHDWLIKRVAALPGDPTPDLVLSADAPGAQPLVPAGQLVVLGDNLAVSQDSRELGYIPADRVLGVAIRALPT
jgi:signal peptidase I